MTFARTVDSWAANYPKTAVQSTVTRRSESRAAGENGIGARRTERTEQDTERDRNAIGSERLLGRRDR